MGKDYGVDRTVDSGTPEYSAREAEVAAMKASGKYTTVEMSEKGGGYVAIEKGTKHKPEEIEAAHHMADAGYKVILTEEGGSGMSPDGKVFNFVYEQATPNPNKPMTRKEAATSVKKALEHGVKKVRKVGRQGGIFPLDVAVIYDKYHSYDRRNIEAGIMMFEKYGNFRYKKIIVISKSGNVYEHYHNDL